MGRFQKISEKKTWFYLAIIMLLMWCYFWTGQYTITAQSNSKSGLLNSIYLLFSFASVVFLGVIGYFLFIFKKLNTLKIEKIAAVLMFVTGLLYSAVLPPFSSPDEYRHFLTSYQMANRIMFIEDTDVDGTVLIRKEDCRYLDGYPEIEKLKEQSSITDYAYIINHFFDSCQDNTMVRSDYRYVPTANPVLMIPQAIGIVIARILEVGFVCLLYMGRLTSLIFYVLIVYFAAKIIPYAKAAVFIPAALPMSLELAASYSYDSQLISLVIIFIAYVVKLREMKGRITAKHCIFIILLGALIAPIKVIYVLVLALCLIIPKDSFASKRQYYITLIVTAVLGISLSIAGSLHSLSTIVTSTDKELVHSDVGRYTADFLFSHPKQFATVVFNTIRLQTDFYYQTMIGQLPGKLDTGLETFDIVSMSFVIVMLLGAVVKEDDIRDYPDSIFKGLDRFVIMVIIVGIIFLALISMLFGWTAETSIFVQGVQGRYFIPLLPLGMLLVRSRKLKAGVNFNRYLLYACICLHMISLSRIFERVCGR